MRIDHHWSSLIIIDHHWSSLIIIDHHWSIDSLTMMRFYLCRRLQVINHQRELRAFKKTPLLNYLFLVRWSEHIRLVATCCGNPASSTSSLAMWSWPPWHALCSAVQPSTEKCAKTSALYMTSKRVIFTFALQTSIDYVTQNRGSIGAEGLSLSRVSSGHHPPMC